jgi:hypothetical protein
MVCYSILKEFMLHRSNNVPEISLKFKIRLITIKMLSYIKNMMQNQWRCWIVNTR